VPSRLLVLSHVPRFPLLAQAPTPYDSTVLAALKCARSASSARPVGGRRRSAPATTSTGWARRAVAFKRPTAYTWLPRATILRRAPRRDRVSESNPDVVYVGRDTRSRQCLRGGRLSRRRTGQGRGTSSGPAETSKSSPRPASIRRIPTSSTWRRRECVRPKPSEASTRRPTGGRVDEDPVSQRLHAPRLAMDPSNPGCSTAFLAGQGFP